jgi:hypothetical protein
VLFCCAVHLGLLLACWLAGWLAGWLAANKPKVMDLSEPKLLCVAFQKTTQWQSTGIGL